MKIQLNSFRSKITISLIVVVASVSLIAFYVFNYSLNMIIHKENKKNIVSVLSLFKDQFYYTLGNNEGKIIYSLLDTTIKNTNIKNAYLFDSKNELIYPLGVKMNSFDTLNMRDQLNSTKSIELRSFTYKNDHFTRAFISLPNSQTCYKCHDPSVKNIGTIVVDFSFQNTKKSSIFAKRYSFLFTTLMLLVLGSVILFIHYKFIRTALADFYSTINAVNNGDLYKRLSIPETKELGKLGLSFNKMLDNFQNTQKELQIFHKEELRNNYKLATIGEMSSRLAHEIRNPITGIANAIEIINSENTDKKNQPILVEIQRQANRVNNTITELLNYSRQKDINLQENNINDLLKSLVFFLENQSHNKEIVFKLELQKDIPVFEFDYSQMEDVFLNLGLNAIQATPKKGTITFNTNYIAPKKSVKISVCDTGKGIPNNIKTKIFHPFFTTRNEGTGLGLAIVKEIIDKHNGEIWVEDNSKTGSTFFILLPVENI
ncbi:MAG: ATP-binding protein [Draconibacterium sp.]|nr:ATP-binding protein [Draconibacterium sp.]